MKIFKYGLGFWVLMLVFSAGSHMAWAVDISASALNNGTPPTYNANETITVTGSEALTQLGGWRTLKQLSDAFSLVLNDATTTIANDVMLNNTAIRAIKGNKVNSIGPSAFLRCTELVTLDFPEATDIAQSAFENCAKLTSASFPLATTIGASAFSGCSELVTLDFSEATNIGATAFTNCKKLVSASFPLVTTVGTNAFEYCEELATLDFPKAATINNAAFRGCRKLDALLFGDMAPTVVNNTVFTNVPAALKIYTNGAITPGQGNYPSDAIVKSYTLPTTWPNMALDQTVLSLVAGANTMLVATPSLFEANPAMQYTWSSGYPAIATVDPNGRVAGVAAGTTMVGCLAQGDFAITVAGGGTENVVWSAYETCAVTVTPAPPGPGPDPSPSTISVTGVTMSKTALDLKTGETSQLAATVQPADATNPKVTWSSSNPDVVSVDQTGKVTAVGPGTATITATTDDGKKTATCEITVTEAPAPGPTEKTLFTINVADCEIVVTRNADGTLSVKVRIPFAQNSNPALLDTVKMIASSLGLANVSYGIVNADGSETPVARMAASAPYLEIRGTAANRDAIENGVVTKIEYTLKGDNGLYAQTFANGGLKLADMPGYPSPEPTPSGSGSSGCDAGLLSGAGLAAVALAGMAICRKKS